MLIKIIYFLRGYVEIMVHSHFVERFINICTNRNFYLWDIKYKSASDADMKMSLRSFRKLRPIAKITNSKVRIKNKNGLPILLHRYKKRYFFLYGTLVASCLIYLSSQFVWSIEIFGNENISEAEIVYALDECGLSPGTYKRALDARDLKNNMLLKIDRLSWIWVDIKGSRAIVNIKEKRPAPTMQNSSVPCDIVASKAGVITSFVAKQGQSVIETGQTVSEGELLISGVVQSERISPRYLHAEGEVYARTWYELSQTYPLTKEIRTPTGKSTSKNTLRLFGIDINFFINPSSPYENSDTTTTAHDLVLFGIYSSISWKSTTYSEVEVTHLPISEEEVKEKAAPTLYNQILSTVSPGSTPVSQISKVTSDGSGNAKVTLTMEFIEQIGKEKIIENISVPESAENTQ